MKTRSHDRKGEILNRKHEESWSQHRGGENEMDSPSDQKKGEAEVAGPSNNQTPDCVNKGKRKN